MKAAKWREFIFGAASEIIAEIVKMVNRMGYCISCQAFSFRKGKVYIRTLSSSRTANISMVTECYAARPAN